jgi:hypothetical protein
MGLDWVDILMTSCLHEFQLDTNQLIFHGGKMTDQQDPRDPKVPKYGDYPPTPDKPDVKDPKPFEPAPDGPKPAGGDYDIDKLMLELEETKKLFQAEKDPKIKRALDSLIKALEALITTLKYPGAGVVKPR